MRSNPVKIYRHERETGRNTDNKRGSVGGSLKQSFRDGRFDFQKGGIRSDGNSYQVC